MRILIISIFISMLLAGCGSEQSKTKSKTDSSPETKPQEVASSGNGRTLYATCIACHGEQGEGNQSIGSPSIAGLNSWYIITQLKNFKSAIRSDDSDSSAAQMVAIARTIKDEDIQPLAQYISRMETQISERTIYGDIENGKSVYNMICGACHGPGAKGNEALSAPKLAGLNDWYLHTQFEKFRNGQRGTHPEDIFGAQMAAMAGTLPTEAALADVISYISSINP